VLPLLRADWNMSAGEAGLVQSAWHVGYLVSLFAAGFLSDRFGARRTFLTGNLLAAASAMLFAVFTDGFLSALLLHGLLGLCSGSSYTPGLTLISERLARRSAAAPWASTSPRLRSGTRWRWCSAAYW
jgi:MFS family permease